MAGQRLNRNGIQLAQPLSERNLKSIGRVCIAQPKFNGERCWVYWMDDKPILITSYGNEFYFLDHIKNELMTLPRYNWDGELYRHGWPREQIDSAVRTRTRRHPDNEGINFIIFDVKGTDRIQADRINLLNNLEGEFNSIKICPSTVIHTSDWIAYAVEYVKEGYEGIILRDLLSTYEVRRIPQMIKFKPTAIDYYLIIGYKEGTGWAEGMLGSFEVRGPDNTSFYVGTGKALTKEKRKYYWEIKDTIVGMYLKVKHEPLTTSGNIPICTVALDVVSEIPKEHEDYGR